MKFYHHIFLSILLSVSACAGSEKKTRLAQKIISPIDFKSKGLEDLSGSAVMKDIICQSWDNKEDAAEAKDIDGASAIDLLYRGYCFFKDGTVVKDPRGNLEAGNWTLSTKKPFTIVMEFDHAQRDTQQLAYLTPEEMILCGGEANHRTKSELTAGAICHIDLLQDPFYVSNILWRIRPALRETGKAVKQRLQACIHFFILFYEEKINTEAKTLTFAGLPTCFVWYAGAVGLQDESNLQNKWINCFYNKAQAIQAYHLACKLMKLKLDLPKKESSWLNANLAILKEMETKIDAIN